MQPRISKVSIMCLLHLLLSKGSYGSSDRYMRSKEQRNKETVADVNTHPICTHITSLLSQPIRRNEIHEMCREEMDGKMIHEICQEACDEFVVDSRLLKSYREEILEFDFNIFSKFLASILFVQRDSDSHAIYFHSLL